MRTAVLLFSALAAAVCTSLLPSASAATRGPWQDLLVLDCSQNLYLLPSHPLLRTSLTASAATQLYTYVVNTIRSRVSCHCPSLSAAELAQSFNADFGSFLRAVETNADNSTSRSRCGLTASMDMFGIVFAQPLGNTCTYAQWTAGGPCQLQVPVPNFDFSLQLALQQCPGSVGQTATLPYVSVSCSGAACSDLMVPCSSNADCVNSNCTSIAPAAASAVNSALSSFFDAAALFPQSEQDSACPAKYTSANVGAIQLNAMMTTLQQAILPYAKQSGSLNLSFCGVDQFINNGINVNDITVIDWAHPANIWSSLLFWGGRNVYELGPLSSFVSSLPSAVGAVIAEVVYWVGDLVSPVGRQVATLFYTTYTANYTRATWDFNMAWDGTLDSGESVTSSSRIAGDEFPSVAAPTVPPLTTANSYTPLLYTTCDLVVSVLPGQVGSVSIRLPNAQVALQAAGARLSDLATCRDSTISASQVNAYFNPASAQWWLNMFTVPAGSGQSPFANAPNIATPADLLYGAINAPALNMPSTCTLDQYSSTGQCAGEYSGFNGLFGGLDLTLRWTLTSCAAYPSGLPALNLQCVGSDCATFFSAAQLQACTQDTDCTAPSTCTALSNTLLPTPFNSWLFTRRDNTCDNSNRNALDVANYVRTYLGLPTQSLPVSSSSSLGYCSMKWQQSVISSPSRWVANLTQTFPNNGTVTLNGLNGFIVPAPVVPSSSSTGASIVTGGTAGSTTGINPSSLPPNSAEVSFVLTLPPNPTPDFASLLLTDVAVDMALAYNGSASSFFNSRAFVTSTQLLQYLELIGLTSSASSPSQGVFSFYVLGTVTQLLASETAVALSNKLASDIQSGSFQTYNSQAVVPTGQTVSVTTINAQKNGGVAVLPYSAALLVTCALAALWVL